MLMNQDPSENDVKSFLSCAPCLLPDEEIVRAAQFADMNEDFEQLGRKT